MSIMHTVSKSSPNGCVMLLPGQSLGTVAKSACCHSSFTVYLMMTTRGIYKWPETGCIINFMHGVMVDTCTQVWHQVRRT